MRNGIFLKSCVSEICVKRIRINQGVGVYLPNFIPTALLRCQRLCVCAIYQTKFQCQWSLILLWRWPIKQSNKQANILPPCPRFNTFLRLWSIPSRFTMTSTTCPRHLSTGSILSSELSAAQSKQHNLTPSTTIALLLLSSQFYLITVGRNT